MQGMASAVGFMMLAIAGGVFLLPLCVSFILFISMRLMSYIKRNEDDFNLKSNKFKSNLRGILKYWIGLFFISVFFDYFTNAAHVFIIIYRMGCGISGIVVLIGILLSALYFGCLLASINSKKLNII